MHDSDAHYIPQAVLKLMTPTQSVFMIFKKSPKNVFQLNSHGILNVVKVNRFPSENKKNTLSCECNDDKSFFLFKLLNILVFGKKYSNRQAYQSFII